MLTAMLLDPKYRRQNSAGLKQLAKALRDVTLLSEPFLQKKGDSTAEYNALRNVIGRPVTRSPGRGQVKRSCRACRFKDLPKSSSISRKTPSSTLSRQSSALVLPRFGRVLKYLDVVGGMLERDEPLKPAILVFSRVNEMIYELTTFIDNRLERFPDAEVEMFASLDAASYTASMELKKVYAQELAGVSELRPAPSIYARTETAYALLHDGFQLILAGFAKIVDPAADIFAVFPEFKLKREHSLALRRELDGRSIKTVQTAENEPEDRRVDALKGEIREFMLEPATYLFFKDTETVGKARRGDHHHPQQQRPCPLLHRFGAYLDTLLGQVSLRAVLAERS